MEAKVRKLKVTAGDGKVLLEEEIRVKSNDLEEVGLAVQLLRVISSESRYKVLRCVAKKAPLSFSDIHKKAGYSQKTIAQCLDDLLDERILIKESEGYMLSPLGKLMLNYLMETAYLIRKVRALENIRCEFE